MVNWTEDAHNKHANYVVLEFSIKQNGSQPYYLLKMLCVGKSFKSRSASTKAEPIEEAQMAGMLVAEKKKFEEFKDCCPRLFECFHRDGRIQV